jgi:hypothetical protein
LNIAIRGLNRLVANNWKFTESKSVEFENKKWLGSLNGVIRYLSPFDYSEFLKVPEINANYLKYVSSVKNQGMKPTQQWKFQEEVLRKFQTLGIDKDKFIKKNEE